ncbi:hypothetical protein L798_13406 [Zootermopsis nevadensis]|uniref:Uncharacterized protein n=1 Tax=Zootermopsis nevadensis TaxID=136037 RepID=A0A067R0R6_ZOONE|nr:hypothetical protein L798_13406 [Zootermopsis nevadensis]
MDYHQHTVPAGPPLVAVPAPSHPLTHHQLHQLQTLVQAEDSTSSRWSQYQQLWRHHHMQHINDVLQCVTNKKSKYKTGKCSSNKYE